MRTKHRTVEGSVEPFDGAYALEPVERERAIASIVDGAMSSYVPPRRRMWETYTSLSLRDLLFGIEDCAALSLCTFITGLIPAAIIADSGGVAAAVFVLSPLFFAVLQGLVVLRDVESGTVAWRASCRVSFQELGALRMLVFGAVAVLLTVPFAVVIWAASAGSASFWWTLSLAAASLAVYGALALFVYRGFISARSGRGLLGEMGAVAIPAVVWIGAGVGIGAFPNAAELLFAVPPMVFFVVALVAAFLFIRSALDIGTFSTAEYA